jgi:membrane protein DedA with SNARE-associated domain
MQFIQSAGHFLIMLFDAYRFPILFAFLFAEADGVFLPVPGDTFLALAASQQGHPPSLGYAFAVLAIAIVAVNLGALSLFTIMKHGGRRFVERYGKYFFLNSKRLNRLEQWYRHHGNLAITVGWLIPGTRILTAAVAGLADVSYRVYVPFALLGSLIWALAVYGVGTLIYFEGPAVNTTLSHVAGSVFVIAVAVAVIAIVVVNVWHGNHHRRRFNVDDLNFLPALEKGARAVGQVVEHEVQSIERGAKAVAEHLSGTVEQQSDRNS